MLIRRSTTHPTLNIDIFNLRLSMGLLRVFNDGNEKVCGREAYHISPKNR